MSTPCYLCLKSFCKALCKLQMLSKQVCICILPTNSSSSMIIGSKHATKLLSGLVSTVTNFAKCLHLAFCCVITIPSAMQASSSAVSRNLHSLQAFILCQQHPDCMMLSTCPTQSDATHLITGKVVCLKATMYSPLFMHAASKRTTMWLPRQNKIALTVMPSVPCSFPIWSCSLHRVQRSGLGRLSSPYPHSAKA